MMSDHVRWVSAGARVPPDAAPEAEEHAGSGACEQERGLRVAAPSIITAEMCVWASSSTATASAGWSTTPRHPEPLLAPRSAGKRPPRHLGSVPTILPVTEKPAVYSRAAGLTASVSS